MPRRGRPGDKGDGSPSQPRRGRPGGKGEGRASQPRQGRPGGKEDGSPSQPRSLCGGEADAVPESSRKKAQMDETQATTRKTTFTLLEELDKEIGKLQIQKMEILRERERAKAQVDELIDRNLVIAFVEELEKAHQYCDFKEYLKKNDDIEADDFKDNIYRTLAESPVRKERFKKVNNEAIRIAINARFSEIKNGQHLKSWYGYMNWLISCKTITSDSVLAQDMETVCSVDNRFPGLSSDERKWELNNYKSFLSLWVFFEEDKDEKFREKIKKEYDRASAKLAEEYDYYATVDLIYGLVFKARQAKHVMDENPEREIKQIIESQPSTYLRLVKNFKEMMMSTHTRVLVRGISRGATEDDVKGVFSVCGMIERIEFKRVEEGNHDAFVTYKDPDGAHRACLLEGPKVCELDVFVVRVFNYNHPSGDVDDADEPTLEEVENFINSMHDRALEKYKKLRSVDTIVEEKSIITGTLDREKDTELIERERCLVDKSGTLDKEKDNEPENKPSRKRKMPSR